MYAKNVVPLFADIRYFIDSGFWELPELYF